MIVFENRRLVIITPPHTASGNLHRALCTERLGGRWVIGLNPDGEADHHTAELATSWRDWSVAVVIRHPLDRLIGLYRHHQGLSEQSGWDPIPWWMFAAMVLSDHPDLSWFYKRSICELVAAELLERATLLRFETLTADVSNLLGDPVALSAGWSDPNPEELTDATTCLQMQWHHRADRHLGGYDSRI